MKVLAAGQWRDGFLDYALGAGDVRIAVTHIVNLLPVRDMHYVRPRSWRMLYHYAREVGIGGVIRRVRSRLSEAGRNDKFLSCGFGVVVEDGGRDGGGDPALRPGTPVRFIAPCHPPACERLVIDRRLVTITDPIAGKTGTILHGRPRERVDDSLTLLLGFVPESGVDLLPATVSAAHAAADALLAEIDWAKAEPLPFAISTVSIATSNVPAIGSSVLIGLGNYAKTVILPSVAEHLAFGRIHDIDPTQLGPVAADAKPGYSTSPRLLDQDRPDAVFIAGYHHSHAALAIDALARGAYAIVEKPLVTKRDAIAPLLEAVRQQPRFFACFHKRYSAYNSLALTDLDHRAGQPIDYHCIVFETPLPARHWYRWPNSRSRLTSNGCHWIDHFLTLNDHAPILTRALNVARSGVTSVMVELANGACFTMTLTDHGSERVGVRDHVELRLADRTVTIDDSSRYRAETSSRILRTERRNRGESYRLMYSSIARKVRNKACGDSLESIEQSTTLVLDLEDMLEIRQPGR